MINPLGRSPREIMKNKKEKQKKTEKINEDLERFDEMTRKLFRVPINEVRDLEAKKNKEHKENK